MANAQVDPSQLAQPGRVGPCRRARGYDWCFVNGWERAEASESDLTLFTGFAELRLDLGL